MSDSLKTIEGMDIYLIDQIMKGRYLPGQHILDAGAGGGRNLNWFFSNDFNVSACDHDPQRKELIAHRNPGNPFAWETADLSDLPYADSLFDHVICNAVLHFAKSEEHMDRMWSELVRVIRTKGTLFVRTCCSMGIEELINPVGQGRFLLPDGSERYLVDHDSIARWMQVHQLELLEPIKSVNVHDQRVMCTLVLVKQ